MAIPACMKTFVFNLHTRTLPVKTWMQATGLYALGPTMYTFCNKPETVEHCFHGVLGRHIFRGCVTKKKDRPPPLHHMAYDFFMRLATTVCHMTLSWL